MQYTEKEIMAIVQGVIATEKDRRSNQILNPSKEKYEKLVSYYPSYSQIVKLYEETRTHSDMDYFPEKLFKEKAPNQDEKEFEYEKGNYKPCTVPFWGRAEASVGRIWNKENFSIKYPDQKQGEYFETGIPFYGSILYFFSSVYTSWKLKDPNALLAIKPYKLPEKKDKDGNLIADDTQLIEPVPYIYLGQNVIRYEEEVYALVLTDEKSMVKRGSVEVKEGRIFEFYDVNNIYKITQYGNKEEETYRIELYYPHNLGFLPCDKLRGKPIYKNGTFYYESYFRDAVPALDEALIYNSILKMSTVSQAYPVYWEITDRCLAPGCLNGKAMQDGKLVDCPECNGTGDRNKKSPTGKYKVQMPGKLDGDNKMPIPPLGWESPDIAVLTHLDKIKDKSILQAFTFQNVDVSNTLVKGSETATERMIDREEFFSFLLKFSDECFEALKWCINTMGKMRYGSNFKEPEIRFPNNFSLRTFNEVTEEINEGKTAGLPDIAMYKLLQEYIKLRFGIDARFASMINLIVSVDSLLLKSDQDISSLKAQGLIEKWEAILHRKILVYIEDRLKENDKFLEYPKNAKEELISLAKQDAAAGEEAGSAPNILAEIENEEGR